jgi:hypothetical protein
MAEMELRISRLDRCMAFLRFVGEKDSSRRQRYHSILIVIHGLYPSDDTREQSNNGMKGGSRGRGWKKLETEDPARRTYVEIVRNFHFKTF